MGVIGTTIAEPTTVKGTLSLVWSGDIKPEEAIPRLKKLLSKEYIRAFSNKILLERAKAVKKRDITVTALLNEWGIS